MENTSNDTTVKSIVSFRIIKYSLRKGNKTMDEPENKRMFKAKYLGATNTKGTRFKIIDN